MTRNRQEPVLLDDDAGRLVRPYTVCGGRTRPTSDFDLLTLVRATGRGTHGYLAGHGYACVRLDVRGVGDSEGVYGDQFTAQYTEDAIEAIAWLARQPW